MLSVVRRIEKCDIVIIKITLIERVLNELRKKWDTAFFFS